MQTQRASLRGLDINHFVWNSSSLYKSSQNYYATTFFKDHWLKPSLRNNQNPTIFTIPHDKIVQNSIYSSTYALWLQQVFKNFHFISIVLWTSIDIKLKCLPEESHFRRSQVDTRAWSNPTFAHLGRDLCKTPRSSSCLSSRASSK